MDLGDSRPVLRPYSQGRKKSQEDLGEQAWKNQRTEGKDVPDTHIHTTVYLVYTSAECPQEIVIGDFALGD